MEGHVPELRRRFQNSALSSPCPCVSIVMELSGFDKQIVVRRSSARVSTQSVIICHVKVNKRVGVLITYICSFASNIMSAPDIASSSSLPTLNPELIIFTNAYALMAQAGSMFAVCFLTVVLRCYVRAVILRCFGADDWTILLALVLLSPPHP
jgi:hypothetical protein